MADKRRGRERRSRQLGGPGELRDQIEATDSSRESIAESVTQEWRR